jgi:hypothetical protein
MAFNLSALVDNFSDSANALASFLADNPGDLPASECVKIAAAIATMQAVYRDSCNGGV